MKTCSMVPAVALCVFLTGCGILRNDRVQNVAGIWTGRSVIGYRGVAQEWHATLVLGEDLTFTLTYEKDGASKKVLMGNYTADLLKRPVHIDLSNVGFSKGATHTCCLAIAEFPAGGKMTVGGLFGKCGEIRRPEKFDRNPSGNHQLYLELKKVQIK